MSGFAERLVPAMAFEAALIERLKTIGWQAHPFGQAQLPANCRDRLKQFVDSARRPSLIRWMPDIIAFREYGNRQFYACLIDAKYTPDDRPNYAIELAAIEVSEIYTNHLFTPTFFVFSDWRALTPRDARQRGTRGPEPVDGSGTPYLLIGKRYSVPLDQYFPPFRRAPA